MRDQSIKKINTLGKIGNVVSIIARILLGIGMAGVICGAIVTTVLPDDLVKVTFNGDASIQVSGLGELTSDEEIQSAIVDQISKGYANFNFSNSTLKLDEVSVEGDSLLFTGYGEIGGFDMDTVTKTCLVGLIAILSAFVMLFFVGDLCKRFSTCETPFEQSIIDSMNRFSIAVIVWAVISMVCDGLIGAFWSGMRNYNVNIDFNLIFVALVLYGLVTIFKYGAKLQQESDETL